MTKGLRAIGVVNKKQSETRTWPSGDQFVETKLWVQVSPITILEVVVGKDFRTADLPNEGEHVDIEVEVSAYTYKSGGVGMRFTATERHFEKVQAVKAS